MCCGPGQLCSERPEHGIWGSDGLPSGDTPRGSRLQSPAPSGANGLSWTAKYGYVYLDAFHIDGLNEAGLGFGALYLPGFAGYKTIAPADNAEAMSNLQLGAWALSQFATVDEVKAALPSILVWGEPLAAFGN